MAEKKHKPISYVPTRTAGDKIEKLAEQLRLPKSRFIELAAETMLDALASGAATVVNGKVVFNKKHAA